jgi:hypothetical protein
VGLFILKCGMSADTNSLHRSVTKVANLEGPEEEYVAEDSPIRDCLPGLSLCFNQSMAAICLLPLKCCVT